jgi:hypothetical protein
MIESGGAMQILSRLREVVERPLRDRLRAAMPRGPGDAALAAILGAALARRPVAERVLGEAETFLLKSALFFAGVRLDRSALAGVGSVWKEDLGQRHYDPDARSGHGELRPQTLLLPHGLSLPLSFCDASPFLLARDGERLVLSLDGLAILPVELERRPAYYARTTRSGLPMAHVGVHRLERQVLVEYNASCKFFAERTACLFCGIIAEPPILKPRHARFFGVTPDEVAEVVEAAYADGAATEMQLTGGVVAGRAEVPYFLEVGRAMRARLGVETVRGSQAVLCPPATLAEIDALRAAGWEGVAFNLEIWDERLWPGIVPGKAALLPRDRWIAALEHAVQVFGKGNVATVLVAGLEPKTSALEGIGWLAERGVYGVPIPWAPAPGSALEGHQSPTAAWHLDLLARTLDLWERHGLAADRHSSAGLPYRDLARMRAHVREDERAGRARRDDLRRRLAFEGRLPEAP